MLYELVFGGSLVQTCMVGILTALLVYWMIQRRKYKLPPGPIALPLIGNYFQLDTKNAHQQIFKQWSKKYGPVVTVQLGPVKMIFINNLETAMEVLVKKSTEFAGRSNTPSLNVLTENGKDIALGQYSPMWKLQRKIATSALRRYMQGSALENRVHEAVETGFKEMEKETGAFDPKEYINYIIGNILVGLCFGGKYDFKDSEVTRIMKLEDDINETFSHGVLEDYVPGLQYVYTSTNFKKLKYINNELREFMRRKFYEEEKNFSKDNLRHFTDCLILARMENKDEDGKEVLTDTHLIQTCSDIFFAGMDTTRLTLTFAITHMMAFPDIQAKVQEELDKVVAGYHIPKGTTIGINHWGLHNDPELWEEPERFIPERFLDENGLMGPTPPGWLPFSAGKRGCLGEFVAKPELHLLFASLMQRFEWRCQSGYIPDLIPDGNMLGIVPKECKAVIKKRVS